MPLRTSVKAQQALYAGIPRSMVKRQSALSPEDENDSTASEEIKLPGQKSETHQSLRLPDQMRL
ncbi:hypothetical protein EDD11_008285 [Mortierella claussenii]|nr:hypothetical protein EDD11_008285 [Mortierella claussenii]